jgi:glycosyltransferase involved in cell wall biosynthesis
MMAEISVITSVFNSEKYIEESIDSILNQTFTDFEIIIINDGSTDNTSEIIQKYTDPRIKFINYKDNQGVLIRSKEAISLANGKYIAIQDADDISMPLRLEKQLNFLNENNTIFCVGSWAEKIDLLGSFIGIWNFPPLSHRDIVFMLISLSKCPIINPSSFFRRDGYFDVGGYSPDNSIRFAHDIDFWTRSIIQGKKLANLSDILIKYRVNPEGMSRSKKHEQLADHIRVISNFKQGIKNVKF